MRARTVALALAVLSLSACSRDERVTTIKLAHGLPTTHPVHEAMVFLAERAKELSAGSLRVDVHPAEQLGTERECLELLQIGSIGMTKVSASVLENFVEDYAVFGLPYLFRDGAHRERVFDGAVGQEILLSGLLSGLRGLVYYDAGSRSFYTKDRPVLRPEDLAGLKLRTQESTLAMRMVEAMGGSPTPIAFGELYTALQQGVVDGAENNPPSFHLSGHYEVCKHYSLDEHTATPDVLLVSESLWQELDQAQRDALARAARESAELQRRLWREATEEALAAVRAAGVEIHYPEKDAFARAVESVYDGYRDHGEILELARRIRETE